MSDIAIKVEGIGKRYRLGKKKSGELRETFGNLIRTFKPTATSQQSAAQKDFWALKDISFEVKQGEAVGIIGRNGAGKSTLLKVLSRITKPTTGRFEINGRVSSLLEVGTGFHPELTGRENIYLNGTILGMRRSEIKTKFDEIIAFSGVEEFIDTPVKHYSSGMKVRLAFSVAAHLEPEILIIDEVLAVGDAEFQKKCLGKMEDVTGEGRTVLFVSHDLNAISNLCKKCMLIQSGKITHLAKTNKIISLYQNQIQIGAHINISPSDKPISIISVETKNANGEKQLVFESCDQILIEFNLRILSDSDRDLFFMVVDKYKRRVFAHEHEINNETMRFIIEPNFLVRGTYSIKAMVNKPHKKPWQVLEEICPFEITDNTSLMAKHGVFDYGVVHGKGSWLE